MRILYLGCHSIHEADELSLFWELGHDYFGLHSSYMNPFNPVDRKRGAIPGNYHPHLIEVAGHSSRDNIHPEIIEPHDIIICLHIPDWVINNWDKMKHKTVIWRCNGQASPYDERRMKRFRDEGMKIIRWSPMEANTPDHIGSDVVIRGYKNPAEFQGWTGETREVITVAQNYINRGEFCHFDIFNKVTKDFPRKLYGPDNDNANIEGGELEFNELKKRLREARVFFYTGTQPASYTLGFIEAWMTGIPIVAIGKKLGNSLHPQYETFEIPYLIENGVNGFVSDDIVELKSYVNRLLDDHDLAKRIGQAGREKAVQIFGKENIRRKWTEFFNSLQKNNE